MARSTNGKGTGTRAGATGMDTRAGAGPAAEAAPAPGINLSVVCGACSGPPEIRVLESGTRLATFGVRCPSGGGGEANTSVPVTVWDPAAGIATLEAGTPIVVVGRLRRRFFQRPGGVGSRVDLEAEVVGRARDRRKVAAAHRRAAAALEEMATWT
jgi:hypothetical protein